MNLNQLYDYLTGRCVRQISYPNAPKNAIYLTFDDGPTPHHTDQVLDLLQKHNIKATFFLIASKIEQYPDIALKIKNQGHAIGNHSYDHNPIIYFQGQNALSNWIIKAESTILEKLNISSIGFRSPIGLKIPPLMNVLKKLNIPLVLWNVRFFDAIYGLTSEMVLKKMNKIIPCSIILLHDSHSKKNQTSFLSGLEVLILECKKKQLEFCLLTKENIANSYGIKS